MLIVCSPSLDAETTHHAGAAAGVSESAAALVIR